MDTNFSNSLKTAMAALVENIDNERRTTDCYKDMFKSVEGLNFESMLRDLNHKMMGLILTAGLVIQDKTGKPMTRNASNLLKLLPYLEEHVEQYIKAQDGLTCCVDKTYCHIDRLLKEALSLESGPSQGA